MAKVKFEVLRDEDGVRGYRLGDWYLMKVWGWYNSYSWVLNKTGDAHYFYCEFSDLLETGEIELVGSCKEGKAKLIKKFQNDNIETGTGEQFPIGTAPKGRAKKMKRRRVMSIEEIREESSYYRVTRDDSVGIMALVEVENMGFCKDGVTRWYTFTNEDGERAIYFKR